MSPKSVHSCSASLICLGLLLLAGASAHAQQWTLTPSLGFVQMYDDNVFSDASDEEASLVNFIRPALALTHKNDQGSIALSGQFNIRRYWRFSELNSVDQFYALRFDRRLTSRWSFNGRLRESLRDQVDAIFDEAAPGEETTDVIEGERPDLRRTDLDLKSEYLLTPRTALIGEFRLRDTEYDSSDIVTGDPVDALDLALIAMLRHQLNPQDTLSLSITRADTTTEPASSQSRRVDRDNDQISGRLSWARSWSPAWVSEASLGYSWLRSRADDVPIPCESFDPGCSVLSVGSGFIFGRVEDLSSRDSSVVGSLSLTRHLGRGFVTLTYLRDQRTGGGTVSTSGSGVDIDTISLRVRYKLTQAVSLLLDGSFWAYESAPDDGTEIDSENIRGRLRVEWRIRRHLITYAELQYFDQDSRGLRGSPYTRRRASLGFRYSFDREL